MELNNTLYNIDSECNLDTIFVDEQAKRTFMHQFYKQCFFKERCIFDLDEIDLGSLISNNCIDRVFNRHTGITNNEFIVVVDCQTHLVYFPIGGIIMSKETMGIVIVCFDMMSLLIMTFTFVNLKKINQEYLDIVDNLKI